MEVEGCFGALGGVCSLPSTVRAFWAVGIKVVLLYTRPASVGKAFQLRGAISRVSGSHQHGFDFVLQTVSFQIPDSLKQLCPAAS